MKDKVNLRKELQHCRREMQFIQCIECSPDENRNFQNMVQNGQPLPENIHRSADNSYLFYRIYESDLTEAERMELIEYRKLSALNTIKSCVVFFTVLTVISLILYLLITSGACGKIR